jgi:hypothetical protein
MMDELARDCVLCADEINLNSFLFYNTIQDEILGFHQTFVLQNQCPCQQRTCARGIHINWKQPVVYFFVLNSCPVTELKEIVFQAIKKLIDIGLNVLGFITDQGSNFIKLTNSLGVCPSKTYFYVNSKQIFISLIHLIC